MLLGTPCDAFNFNFKMSYLGQPSWDFPYMLHSVTVLFAAFSLAVAMPGGFPLNCDVFI